MRNHNKVVSLMMTFVLVAVILINGIMASAVQQAAAKKVVGVNSTTADKKALEKAVGPVYKSPDGKWSTYMYHFNGTVDAVTNIVTTNCKQDVITYNDGTKSYGAVTLTYKQPVKDSTKVV